VRVRLPVMPSAFAVRAPVIRPSAPQPTSVRVAHPEVGSEVALTVHLARDLEAFDIGTNFRRALGKLPMKPAGDVERVATGGTLRPGGLGADPDQNVFAAAARLDFSLVSDSFPGFEKDGLLDGGSPKDLDVQGLGAVVVDVGVGTAAATPVYQRRARKGVSPPIARPQRARRTPATRARGPFWECSSSLFASPVPAFKRPRQEWTMTGNRTDSNA
jgi:hypothetical protein